MSIIGPAGGGSHRATNIDDTDIHISEMCVLICFELRRSLNFISGNDFFFARLCGLRHSLSPTRRHWNLHLSFFCHWFSRFHPFHVRAIESLNCMDWMVLFHGYIFCVCADFIVASRISIISVATISDAITATDFDGLDASCKFPHLYSYTK